METMTGGLLNGLNGVISCACNTALPLDHLVNGAPNSPDTARLGSEMKELGFSIHMSEGERPHCEPTSLYLCPSPALTP